jgi:SulP family sulfate permease
MNQIFDFFNFQQKINYKTEILSGITVALALVPEAVAFALIAGLSPLTGLYAAFMMGLVTSIFGGRPGMISGATGAVAVVIVAGVGLIESLLTLDIMDEITETRGSGNKEAVAQGAANILSGVFSGMGGCAMIGQSLINTSNGARARLSGIVAAIMLLVFVMFGFGLIESVPMAALTGLMIMVAIGTFEWGSLRTFNKMPKSDIFVMVTVTLVTVFLHNLALAVIIGVVISALVFAWDNAKRIRAQKRFDENGIKHYEIYGPLFFGSVSAFNEKFDVQNDPDEVIIDFEESRVVDMSAIEALNKITERYLKAGKKVHLKHLSSDCRKLLQNAEDIIDVNVMENPTYKVMVNKL